jgi:4-amino-4-deoxy-L-arabinose transferase-like glycosyltransferase
MTVSSYADPRAAPLPGRASAATAAALAAAPLAAVLVLALSLRLWGLDWGLPWAFHPDEPNYVDRAQTMLQTGDPNPRYFENPSFLTYLIAGQLWLVRALDRSSFDNPATAYLLARLDGALLGVASVFLIYALGRRLFDQTVGLVGAALLAVSFLHVRDSHYGVNDVPATALLLPSVLFAARCLQRPTLRDCLLAGLFGGLATSAKYSAGFFFAPLLVALTAAAHGKTGDGGPSRGRLARWAGLAALVSLLGYLLGTPYTLLDAGKFRTDFLTQLGYGNARWLGQSLDPVPLLYITTGLQGFGALPLVLALVGLVHGLRPGRRAATLLVLAYPLAYLAFMLPKSLFFPRLALPLLPFLALLAGLACVELTRRSPSRWQTPALGLLVAAAAAQSLLFSVQHNRIVGQADTRVLANEWVQANLLPGSRLQVESYSLLDRSDEHRTYTPNRANLRIDLFLSAPTDDQLRQFVDKEVGYYVTSSFAVGRFVVEPTSRQDSARRYLRFHRELEQRAQLVATFGAGPDGREVPYRGEDVMTPFWALPEYARTGPTLQIYQLPSTLPDTR